jgi:paraquat-inducible protein B
MTNTGLNLIRIKESIDASKKYIDMMYGMALNNNFNDNDFTEFTRQFQELINLVERSIANSGNKPADQRYVQNAQGIINSPEVKDMMNKIQQIQNARFKQQLDSGLQNINPQNLQRFNGDFQRLKNGMTQMLESSMQEAKSTSYQQFKPAQQTQTTYQSQPQQSPQGQVSQMQ